MFIIPQSTAFFIIYILCGLSDIFDGYLARKYNVTSQLGATLDSLADFVFVITVLIVLAHLLAWETWAVVWISIIITVRLLVLIIGFIKYHQLAFLHTNANKFTGFSLFLFPLLYSAADFQIITFILCCIASLSAFEELLITIKSKCLDKNIKTIFVR